MRNNCDVFVSSFYIIDSVLYGTSTIPLHTHAIEWLFRPSTPIRRRREMYPSWCLVFGITQICTVYEYSYLSIISPPFFVPLHYPATWELGLILRCIRIWVNALQKLRYVENYLLLLYSRVTFALLPADEGGAYLPSKPFVTAFCRPRLNRSLVNPKATLKFR